MQIRSRTYLHFISVWRSLREPMPPRHDGAPAETSPSLIYIAVVLAFLLVVLEIDAHRAELETFGLLGHHYSTEAPLLGP